MHKYEVIIYWSGEDRVFVAEIPELAGCMAHGDTQSCALENVQVAIKLWIDSAREHGHSIPQAKERRLMFA